MLILYMYMSEDRLYDKYLCISTSSKLSFLLWRLRCWSLWRLCALLSLRGLKFKEFRLITYNVRIIIQD